MRGMPQTWNSKRDVLYCLDHWPTQAKHALQRFLDSRFEWIIVKKLADDESGVEDDTHRVREVTDEDGNVVERYQLEWKEDPNARLFRLGFTVDEAQNIVS